MAYESWTVDGQPLSTLVTEIITLDGLDNIPDLIGSNVSVPQRHGTIWSDKFYGEASKIVSMIISAANPATGIMPATADAQRAYLDTNLDALNRIMNRPNRLLDIRRTLSGGGVRQAMCEVVRGITPITIGLASSKVLYELTLPYSFWQDIANISSALYAPASGFSLAEFVAATAPMNDLQFVITGPITNPRVTDQESGSWFQYTGTVAALQTLTVDAGLMTITGGGGMVPVMANMSHDGDARWICLNSSVLGLLLNFTGSATTAATKLQVIGKRKYLR